MGAVGKDGTAGRTPALEQGSAPGTERCVAGKATKGMSMASAEFYPKINKTEAVVAKCRHVLNWSGRRKGDCSIPRASCYVRNISW